MERYIAQINQSATGKIGEIVKRMRQMRPELLNPLFKPVSSIAGVGPKLEKAMTRILKGNEAAGTAQIRDLLFHLPYNVIDRRRQPGIANAPEGVTATLRVWVDRHDVPPRGNRRIPYRVHVHDETGEMMLVFFNAHGDYLSRARPIGEERYVSGRVEWFNGKPSMVHPDHIVDEEGFRALPLLEPVYPTTAGLARKTLQKAVAAALTLVPDMPEWTDPALLKREKWPSFGQALEAIHQPQETGDIEPSSPARKRLAHDEFLAGQLALGLIRERMRRSGGIAWQFNDRLFEKVLAAFKWPLTQSQQTALAEIRSDLQKPERMLRLLQGDVGAGKTIVALLSAARVIEAGAQAAIMAPTEILARQHAETVKPLCEPAGIRAEILTGREKGAKRNQLLQALEAGEIDVLIGTHALFQGSVNFRKLGLAIIDEQHRFGVHQRLALGDKASDSDVLVMTATPIPRTLVMTYYGDMAVSALPDKPAGRKPIATSAVSKDRLDDLIARIGRAVSDGQKIYWVCPLVEESEELQATSAEERFQSLQEIFGDQVGLVHGRLSSTEKDAAMEAFRLGQTRILIATTVIEVGVDVPDAMIMILENAERFGLAQMHQLRGRVGRSERESHCILLYRAPLGQIAQERLRIMRETNDGFRIAEEDLKLRGEGEILGTRQSGAPGFNLASPEDHAAILEMGRTSAKWIMQENPQLEGERGSALRAMLYLFGQDQAIRLIRSG